MTPEPTPESTPTPTHIEAVPQPAVDTTSKQTKTAIKRCASPFRRAYEAYLRSKPGDEYDKTIASQRASPAYCKALPPLVGRENIRDFIACVAHGILIDAIPEKKANQLLYAAQVALATLQREQRPRKTA